MTELKERRASLIHLYPGFAVCSDGDNSLRVNLTDEQIVQLAADACELAAKILRWEKSNVRGTARQDADGRCVEPSR